MKNLAGNSIFIFLFRFEIHGQGISFVLNEAIAQDMYPDIDEKMKPLVHTCCETLSRYKHLSIENTIMDGNILEDGCFEVMLSKGLGRHFMEQEKQNLFKDAKHIADLLTAVMNRESQVVKQGKRPLNSKTIKKELEALGQEKSLLANLQWLSEGKKVRPGLRQLRPEDLPSGVTASRGYDHRGHCINLEHKTLGELGRIVLINAERGQTQIKTELHTGQETIDSSLTKQKRELLETIVLTVNQCFDENFKN
jgi:hypothetical protein